MICKNCREEIEPNQERILIIDLKEKGKEESIFKGEADLCSKCFEQGVKDLKELLTP